jgi:hypothetical protein
MSREIRIDKKIVPRSKRGTTNGTNNTKLGRKCLYDGSRGCVNFEKGCRTEYVWEMNLNGVWGAAVWPPTGNVTKSTATISIWIESPHSSSRRCCRFCLIFSCNHFTTSKLLISSLELRSGRSAKHSIRNCIYLRFKGLQEFLHKI